MLLVISGSGFGGGLGGGGFGGGGGGGSGEVARAVAGEPRTVMTRRERRAVERAVREAEDHTGLQFCIYLGPAEGDAHARAESLFVEAGLQERPAVLVLVAPDRRRVEVITAPAVRDRLTDEGAARAIEEMTPYFAEGRYVFGLVNGLRRLADEAGPGTGPAARDLPNILGE